MSSRYVNVDESSDDDCRLSTPRNWVPPNMVQFTNFPSRKYEQQALTNFDIAAHSQQQNDGASTKSSSPATFPQKVYKQVNLQSFYRAHMDNNSKPPKLTAQMSKIGARTRLIDNDLDVREVVYPGVRKSAREVSAEVSRRARQINVVSEQNKKKVKVQT